MAHLHLLVRAEIRRPLQADGPIVRRIPLLRSILTKIRAKRFLRAAVALAGMTIIRGPHAVMGAIPGNEGVSATAILDFSSTTLHEWPYRDPPLLQFDLYTCGATEPSGELFRPLFDSLEPLSFAALLIDRDAMALRADRGG